MRSFICSNCGHEMTFPYGSGQSGRQIRCPQCGGMVHRSHCRNARAFNGRAGGRGNGNCRRGGLGKGG